MNPSVHVRTLAKRYGTFEAVNRVDFDIFPGEVFGLLGPDGAGKTTTVEILEGLRPRSGGDVSVLGFDPGRETRRVKDRIGVCLQATNLPERITVREATRLFASLYSLPVDGDALGNGFFGAGIRAVQEREQNILRRYKVTPITPLPILGASLTGIPPEVALQAATWNAARLLRAQQRIGLVQPGYEASLLVVDGDPTRDISATERISSVVYKGERIRRVELFDRAKNPLE